MQCRDLPALVAEHNARLLIDARFPKIRQRRNPSRVPKHHRRQRHRVHPNIQQRAAAQRRVEQPTLRVDRPDAKPEVRRHHPHVADFSFRDAPPHIDHQREEPRPHRLHQKDALRPRRVDHAFRFSVVDRKRLLAEDRFPGVDAQERVLTVERMRRRYIDRIHVGIVHQRLVRRMATRRIELIGKLVGGFLRTRSDRDEFRVVQRRQPPRELFGDITRSEYSPPNRVHWISFINVLGIVRAADALRATSLHRHARPKHVVGTRNDPHRVVRRRSFRSDHGQR